MMKAIAWSTGSGSYAPPAARIRSLSSCLSEVPPTYSMTM